MAYLHRLALALALGLPLLAVAPATTAAAAPAVANVTISDAGFSPASVTVALGGTVIWRNQGADAHTVTTQGQAPLPFDTGGIGPGNSSSLSFQAPGTYYYTSTTDCENGVTKPAFNCGASYSVTVGQARAAATTPTPQATPPPASPPPPVSLAPAPSPAAPAGAAPTPSAVQQNVTVTISDTGISPATVTVGLGGTVSWINHGDNVHSATAEGGVPLFFDTGGLVTGQIGSLGFSAPGTYRYTSAPDCIGTSSPGFHCGPYTLIVTNASAVATPPPAPSPTAAPTPPPTGDTHITINDSTGFQPGSLTVKAGQTVTWTNEGNDIHSVVSNPGYIPGFDSGGLAHGQSFSYTFPMGGSFGYHSSTEPNYSTDTTCQCTVTTYTFNGVVNVQ